MKRVLVVCCITDCPKIWEGYNYICLLLTHLVSAGGGLGSTAELGRTCFYMSGISWSRMVLAGGLYSALCVSLTSQADRMSSHGNDRDTKGSNGNIQAHFQDFFLHLIGQSSSHQWLQCYSRREVWRNIAKGLHAGEVKRFSHWFN